MESENRLDQGASGESMAPPWSFAVVSIGAREPKQSLLIICIKSRDIVRHKENRDGASWVTGWENSTTIQLLDIKNFMDFS